MSDRLPQWRWKIITDGETTLWETVQLKHVIPAGAAYHGNRLLHINWAAFHSSRKPSETISGGGKNTSGWDNEIYWNTPLSCIIYYSSSSSLNIELPGSVRNVIVLNLDTHALGCAVYALHHLFKKRFPLESRKGFCGSHRLLEKSSGQRSKF